MAERFYWCQQCERTVVLDGGEPVIGCPVCDGPLRRISWLTSALRKVGHGTGNRSDIQQRHLQLIQAIWTADGMGQRYFEICQPGSMYYSRFVRRVTELICQGIDAGWIVLVLPSSPLKEDARYALEYRDPERFVAELQALFPHTVQLSQPGAAREARDVESDGTLSSS